MQNRVITYGLTQEQQELLQATIPEEYELCKSENATDVIVTPALCYIIAQTGIDRKEATILRNYCIETVGYANERIIWIGNAAPCETVVAYENFLSLLMELTDVLNQAEKHFATQDMYHSEYAVLPIRAITDALEQEFCGALERKFSAHPDPEIIERTRREWVAIHEVEAEPELAAVHELCLWLRRNKKQYYMEGPVTSGFIPYLLDIIKVNPLPMAFAGNDAVFQDFCSYGNSPSYIFHLPKELEEQIRNWEENHWLKKLYPDQWEAQQCYYPNRLARLNMQFVFDLEEISDPDIPDLCCEDVFHYLLEHDFIEKDAYRGMCSVREGFGLPVITEEMRSADDRYMIEKFQEAEFLPRRTDLMEKKVMAIRLRDRRDRNGSGTDTV